MGQRCLPKPGRTVKQDVFQCLTALLGGGELDLQVLLHQVLTDQIPQGSRPQGDISRVIRLSPPCEDAVVIFRAHCRNYTRFPPCEYGADPQHRMEKRNARVSDARTLCMGIIGMFRIIRRGLTLLWRLHEIIARCARI